MRQLSDQSAAFSPQPVPPREPWPRPQPETSRRPRRDPAPSRLVYKLERMWYRPIVRKFVYVGLPAFMLAMTVGLYLADDTRRAAVMGGFDQMIEQVQNREQFLVKTMEIKGASETVDRALRMMLPVDLPASSFDIDLDTLRADIVTTIDAVEAVDLRISPGGVLAVDVTERQPALMWRHARGIELIDAEGRRVAAATSRAARPDLPLIAGEGGDKFAPEALALIEAAGPLLPRLRGLQRVGERRWDLVLDRGQRILLPETGAVAALERILALGAAQDLFGRDVSLVDLRDPSRPLVRMGLTARNAIRAARGEPLIGPDGQPVGDKG